MCAAALCSEADCAQIHGMLGGQVLPLRDYEPPASSENAIAEADLKVGQPTRIGVRRTLQATMDWAAQHLLERRTVLDEALRPRDESETLSIMRRTPPIPVALLMIETESTRERFAKVLSGARLELDQAPNSDAALASLSSRVHALMFTDNLELVQRARQLPSGAATHIVYVNADDDSGYREGLRAGANDCVSSEARGEQFWAHMTIVRRIADFAASLQLALTDNRILATIDELTRSGSRRFSSASSRGKSNARPAPPCPLRLSCVTSIISNASTIGSGTRPATKC